MSEKRLTAKRKRVQVVSKFRNARHINAGDILTIEESDDFDDGDLVAFEFRGEVGASFLYHSAGATGGYRSYAYENARCRRMSAAHTKILGIVTDVRTPRSRPKRKTSLPVPDTYREGDEVELIRLNHPNDGNAEKYAMLFYTQDIRIGDFVCLAAFDSPKQTPDERLHYYCKLLSRDKETTTILTRFGDVKTYQTIDTRLEGRVVDYWVNDGRAEPPFPIRTMHGISAEESERVDELRTKLDKLRGEGDITDSTATFRLEKQIYDLEHPASDDSILDADHIG